MAATQKGSKWEMKRSLWILCCFSKWNGHVFCREKDKSKKMV